MERLLFSTDNQELAAIKACRAKDAISTELDGETVILNIETGVYNGLDQVGTTIWNLLEKPITFGEITESVMAEYEVEAQRCSDDLCSFLNDLLKKQTDRNSGQPPRLSS